ncbi:rCG38050 [Rattus norvegicus]|uniref:RCG38050 n=1 Tax=Rattus norvegicus TaxID=10116 RepID=A6IVD6_RAT|nr:rCG38050 [Rattus norvegicus]
MTQNIQEIQESMKRQKPKNNKNRRRRFPATRSIKYFQQNHKRKIAYKHRSLQNTRSIYQKRKILLPHNIQTLNVQNKDRILKAAKEK